MASSRQSGSQLGNFTEQFYFHLHSHSCMFPKLALLYYVLILCEFTFERFCVHDTCPMSSKFTVTTGTRFTDTTQSQCKYRLYQN